MSPEAVRAAGRAMVIQHADERAASLAPVITELREQGVTSLRRIASELNARNLRTPAGCEWSATQVNRTLARLDRVQRTA